MSEQENSAASTGRKTFFRRRSVRILLACVVLTVAFLVALPYGIRWYLQKWLVENGAESARIEKVRFTPFNGTFGLEGVEVVHGGKTVFADSTIFVNLGMRHLFSKQAMLQQVLLKDIVLDVEMGSDGSLRIASYSIQQGQKGEEEVVESHEVDTSAPWTLFVDRLDLENVQVRYAQPNLEVKLVIDEATIDKFNTDPDVEAGSLNLKGTVNGAGVELDLPKLYLVPTLDVEGRVVLENFQLGELADLLGDVLEPFAGSAGLEGKVKLAMPESTDIDFQYDGSIRLEGGDIGGKGWLVGGSIGFDGAAAYGMKGGQIEILVDGDLGAKNASFDMPTPLIDIDNPDILISGKTIVSIGDSVLVDTGATLQFAPTTYVAEGFKTGAGDTKWEGKVLVDTGTAEKDLTIDVHGNLAVNTPFFNLEMDQGMMETGNELVSWDGKILYGLKSAEGGGSYVQADGKLVGEKSYYRLPETIDVSQGKLELNGKTDIEIAEELTIAYDGGLSLDSTALGVSGIELAEERSSWHGKLGYTLKKAAQEIAVEGELDLAGIDFAIEESGLKVRQEEVSLKPDMVLTLADTPAFAGSGAFAANGFSMDLGGEPLLRLDAVSVEGLQDDGSGGVLVASLDSSGLNVPSSETVPVGVEVPLVSLRGIKSADLMSGKAEQLVVEKPKVTDKEGGMLLAGLDAITVDGIAMSKDLAASVENVALKQGRFLDDGQGKPLATLDGVAAKHLEYSGEMGLVCERIEVESLVADILKDKKGEPESADEKEQVAKEESGKEGSDQSDAETEAKGIPVRIDTIEFIGNSQFKYADTTLARTFMTLFNIDSLTVTNIDLNKPEQPFTYKLKGNFEKYTPLELEGECAPLAKDLLIRQNLVLKNYSMLRVSPYVVEAIGTFFPSGMLNLNSKLDISEGNIDMKNNLVFKDLVLEGVEGELASELDNQLPVPLSLAVTMLEDKDGLIDLDVPLKGRLSDIDIGTSDLIWTPLSKAISVAVTPYLAYTVLGPAGALTYLGAKMGGELLKTDFPVLTFEKGQRELSEKHLKKLEKAGKMITKELEKKGEAEPELSYSICAKVSVTELASVSPDMAQNQEVLRNEAIRRELFALGEARSLAIKDYLVQNFGIEETRLMICNPGLQFDTEKLPVVEFMK